MDVKVEISDLRIGERLSFLRPTVGRQVPSRPEGREVRHVSQNNARDPSHSDHLDEQHDRLRGQFQEVIELIERRRASTTDVVQFLGRLRDELKAHFDHEEQGGYFSVVVDLAPRFKGRIDALLKQHPIMAKRSDLLCSLAQQSPVGDNWWTSLSDELAALYHEFDQHETDESTLLQEAYTRDIGTDD